MLSTKSARLRRLDLFWTVYLLAGCRESLDLPPPWYLPVIDASVVDASVSTSTTESEKVTPSDAGQDSGVSAADSAQKEEVVASSALPRLSHKQWAIAAQHLLHLSEPPNVSRFIADPETGSGFSNTGAKLDVSSALWSDYQTVSETVAQEVAADPKKLGKLGFPKSAEDTGGIGKAVGSLSARAFRRPLNEDELRRHVELFGRAKALMPERDAISAGAELLIAALLQSPFFVYRVELENSTDERGVAALSDYEIAARLSFMLWDGPPDDELQRAAAARELSTPEQLLTQAQRMLDSALAREKLLDFHRQWLKVSTYDAVQLPAADTGKTAEKIGPALRRETELFLSDLVFDHDGTFSDLFKADFTYANRINAPLYGLEGTFTDEYERVALDQTQRSGLLTQVGFLASHSGVTAPIQRGVFIVRKVLCGTLPPPPKFEQPEPHGTTRRERIESITGQGTCGATCHATMINPAGFPFESFDDLGRFRTEDSGQPVDTSGTYPFPNGSKDYNGAVEWMRIVAASSEAHICYARHWLEFALARFSAAGDLPLIERMATASRRDEASIKRLLLILLESPSFVMRRTESL